MYLSTYIEQLIVKYYRLITTYNLLKKVNIDNSLYLL